LQLAQANSKPKNCKGAYKFPRPTKNKLEIFRPSKIINTQAQYPIQIGYLHQFDYKTKDETGRDFLVIGFFMMFSGNQRQLTLFTKQIFIIYRLFFIIQISMEMFGLKLILVLLECI